MNNGPLLFALGVAAIVARFALAVLLCGSLIVAAIVLAGCDNAPPWSQYSDDRTPVDHAVCEHVADIAVPSGSTAARRVATSARRTTDAPLPDLDPCVLYGDDPGVTLTNGTEFAGEVLVADYCIGAIENVAGCWVSDHVVDLGDIVLETDDLDLWCEFACDGVVETVAVVAGYPSTGNEVRVEFVNPCPGTVP